MTTRDMSHTAVRDTVWAPYETAPVLTPAMAAGPAAVPGEELGRLRTYLAAVVADRRGPVHTAVAFNAAYFGYETGGEGYGNGAFDLDGFPVVTLGGDAPALPVGALVRIETGSDPLYAEIVYKEGQRHDTADGPQVEPAWLSGAPVHATGPGQLGSAGPCTRRELLVPDLTVFGPGLCLETRKLKRLRDHGKWLNRDGHVVMHAHYESAAAAGRDAADAFVDHLLTTQRAALLDPNVPVPLVHLAGTTDEAALRAALTALMEVVAHALAANDDLRRWNHYALTRARVGRGLAQDGPLGHADLQDLAGSVQRSVLPAGRRRFGLGARSTAYTAVGPWLRTVAGAGQQLCDVEYAVSVCRANLALADLVRDTEHGLFPDRDVRVGLDDAFESGGVWRSHHPGTQEENHDPLVPAGLGWRAAAEPPAPVRQPEPQPAPAEEPGAEVASDQSAETAGGYEAPDAVETPAADDTTDTTSDQATAVDQEAETQPSQEADEAADAVQTPDPQAADLPSTPLDGPLPDGDALGGTSLLRIANSEVSWQLTLRLSHLVEGTLPLRPIVGDTLRRLSDASHPVRVELHHPGGELDPDEEYQPVTLVEEGNALASIAWPIDFFPGLRLTLQWPRGGLVVRLSTIELEVPVEVDGDLIHHAYDAQVRTRESAPGSDHSRDSAHGLEDRDLVLRAVRRCGLLTVDGHALLDREALPRTVHGTVPQAGRLTGLETAVQQLLADRKLYAATGSRDRTGLPHYPPRPGESEIPLIGYDPRPRAVPRATAPHPTGLPRGTGAQYYVEGFLRRLPIGEEPSNAQRAAYRKHCQWTGKADGCDLPHGFTFVTAHARTSRSGSGVRIR
ncbi:hypothetical protein [Streptomyces platensis]|uniref:hypothetical protein n=1 Tax=Streptomyces platensis TaxID=58346 RepID=UPI00367EC180